MLVYIRKRRYDVVCRLWNYDNAFTLFFTAILNATLILYSNERTLYYERVRGSFINHWIKINGPD
jgi:hypothetical protein